MSTIFSRSFILSRFDTLRATVHELSEPEICERVARELGLSPDTVETVVRERDVQQEVV